MSAPDDPYRHHPGLRDKIRPYADSAFRTFSAAAAKARLAEAGLESTMPFYSDVMREALRRDALEGHDGDLWVFAYGSLIWDPALDFAEVRRAHAPVHSRRFILVDTHGGRGSADAPGLMAALDDGAGCDGLAFRIEAEKVDEETRILFQREMIAPGYHARFIPLHMQDDQIRALTFLADHDDPLMRADITREEQIRFAATGAGFLGTSVDYLSSVVAMLGEVGISDRDADDLLQAVHRYTASQNTSGGALGNHCR